MHDIGRRERVPRVCTVPLTTSGGGSLHRWPCPALERAFSAGFPLRVPLAQSSALEI